MGEMKVQHVGQNRSAYIQALIREAEVLETMIREDRFEQGVERIGAEQELFMVDRSYKPDARAYTMVGSLPEAFTYEIGRFNLEANLPPALLNGNAFQQTETTLRGLLQQLEAAGEPGGMSPLLTGILPTLVPAHLSLQYMTPAVRFEMLNERLTDLRGGAFEIHISGADELAVALPSVMYEAANTSWQMHLQIDPRSFSEAYNWAQYISGPVLAATANSPLLFGRELWHETRIALFQQSVDTRRSSNELRERHNRVHFGRGWLTGGPAGLFKDQITRFPLLLTGQVTEEAAAVLSGGKAPKLEALRLHNGTIYSWNRPCYGLNEAGEAHLRLENRYVPSGPTVADEMANFAFWVGLMKGMPPRYASLAEETPFDDARANFYEAARSSLLCSQRWNGKQRPVKSIILEELLPIAADGLRKVGVGEEEAHRRLQIVERRVAGEANGACWAARNFRALKSQFGPGVAARELAAAMRYGQAADVPVHNWEDIPAHKVYALRPGAATAGHLMKTDLYTIAPGEPLSMARAIMKWKKVRHLPVEDENGQLVGLLSRNLMQDWGAVPEDTTAGDVMVSQLITIKPDTPLSECARLLKTHHIGSLPVVEQGQIIGLLTDTDFRELFGSEG